MQRHPYWIRSAIPRFHVLILAVVLLGASQAEALSCNDKPNRYRQPNVFSALKETPNIQYGQNKNPLFNDKLVNLFTDIFEPANDTCTKRPLVFFMWGGAFRTGTRQDETGDCRQFAKRGFVCATIDYRMGVDGVASKENTSTPAFMSTQDTRAAVRFFRKNAAQYKIDTGAIYVGGCSSGAYAAMWTGYLDEADEIPPEVNRKALEGGNEGVSGNPGYSSRFAGVLSLSGGVHDTTWINSGDIPMAMVQCSGDPLVHPEGGLSQTAFYQYWGATAISVRAKNVGVKYRLQTHQASCHCPHMIGPGGLDSTIDFLSKSAYEFMTAPPPARLAVALSAGDVPGLEDGAALFDLQGRVLRGSGPGSASLARLPLPAGLYFRK
jgi:para-nitrobenzyl esterase